ncbi:MarR family winged helix-turn-helix transcriptional regulator [Chelativorans xinjiangense]|uniref:MarR family winged helix-turn-helix transcriptional regulator n=1 Tax=Chelativorans xinjiangense TaxID=2681485 RepID=UPI001356DD0A|nr:MarR family transcriptional regulator [Chelativorans xinjiangense]
MQAFFNRNRNPTADQEGDEASSEAELLRLESWLPFRFFTISVRVADLLTSFYGPRYGLSRAAWRTMAIVANRPGASAREICQAGGLDQFTVSRAIASLVENGFARRRTGKTDKRYASIELTKEGWSAFEEISALSKRLDAELTTQIAPEEMAMLDDVLRRLDDASAGMLARGWRGFFEQRPEGLRPNARSGRKAKDGND